MKIYKYGFIGRDHSNTALQWIGHDSLEKFNSNVKIMDDYWYYRNVNITYQYNSLGHRSKEIEEIDLDNYILTVGCSNTEGVGLESDKTYSAVLAEKLNCDYYNMGVGSTGMDVTLHNLIIWFNNIKKKPKAVIIQWPDFTRALTGESADHLRPRGLWLEDEDYSRFIYLGVLLKYFDAKKLMTHHIIKSMIDVPTVYFTIKGLVKFHEHDLTEKPVDNARDLSHPGIKSNQKFADSIYDHLINTECLSFYQNTEQKN